MKKHKAIIEQNPDEPVEKRVLAKAVVDISVAMKRLVNTGLNRRAIVCLVHDSCNVGKPDVRAVLDSLESLAKDYTR